jgi:L,D-peptidoglycan transpeptidase YkuD (ErfK/YbiS/YcfS/YnhG family)
MLFRVVAEGWFTFAGRRYCCALGRGGIGHGKREGDGKTPAGRFALRRVLYRADRLAPPDTGLPLAAIKPEDGWCDDPADRAYNRPVRLPYRARAETLFRMDGLYDMLAVIGYNDQPIVPGAGSAIFLHVARPDYGPTEGCVGLAPDHLREALALADATAEIEILAG